MSNPNGVGSETKVRNKKAVKTCTTTVKMNDIIHVNLQIN